MIGTALSIGASLIGGALNYRSSKKAAARAEEIGKLNYAEYMRQAEVERELGNDQVMNLLENNARQKGMVEGMYAKSGVMLTGTPQASIDKMKQDFQSNVDQASESVNERVERLQQQAKLSVMEASGRAAGYNEQARGDLIQAGFGVLQGAGDMVNGWSGWQKTTPSAATPGGTSVNYGLFDPQMNSINAANSLKGFNYKSNLGSQLKGFGY